MVEFIIKLEQKWGSFEKDKLFWKQRNVAKIAKDTYLNVLFVPIGEKPYRIFEEHYCCKLTNELEEFYKYYNGIMLFSQSFRIFGVNIVGGTGYQTLDLGMENSRLYFHKRCPQYTDMISFGYYAQWNFCFDRTKKEKTIYVISRNNYELVHTFDSLQQLFDHYLPPLIAEYDEGGNKLHPKKNNGLPIYEISSDFI